MIYLLITVQLLCLIMQFFKIMWTFHNQVQKIYLCIDIVVNHLINMYYVFRVN